MKQKLSALIGVCLLTISCASASNARHIATVGAQTAHSTLSVIQDTADLVTCGKATAPPQCITPDVRSQVIAPKLSQAFALDKQIAVTVKAVPPGRPVPAEVAVLYQAITDLANQVLALIPHSAKADAVLASGGVK